MAPTDAHHNLLDVGLGLPEWEVDIEQMLSRFREGRLYSSKYAGIRELIQNAVDSKTKAISIAVDEYRILVADWGIGMNEQDIRRYLLTIFRTSKTVDDIGEFGIGFLSAFVIADSIRLETKTSDTRDEPVGLLFDGITDIRFVPCDRRKGGTTVTLFGRFDVSEIVDYLRTLCAYLQLPVHLNDELISKRPFAKKEPSVQIDEPDMSGVLYAESEERTIKLLSRGLFVADYSPHYPIAGYVDYPSFKLTLSRDEIMRENPEYRSFQQRLRKYRDILMRGLDEVSHRDELIDYVSRSKRFDLVEDKKIFSDAYGRPVSIRDMKQKGEVFFAPTRDDKAVDEALREGREVIIATTKAAHRVLEKLAPATPEVHGIQEYQIPDRRWNWVDARTPEEHRLLSAAATISRFPVRLMRNTDVSVVGQYSEGTVSLNLDNHFIVLLLRKLKNGLPDPLLQAALCPSIAHEEEHSSYLFHNERFFVAYESNLQRKMERLLELWSS